MVRLTELREFMKKCQEGKVSQGDCLRTLARIDVTEHRGAAKKLRSQAPSVAELKERWEKANPEEDLMAYDRTPFSRFVKRVRASDAVWAKSHMKEARRREKAVYAIMVSLPPEPSLRQVIGGIVSSEADIIDMSAAVFHLWEKTGFMGRAFQELKEICAKKGRAFEWHALLTLCNQEHYRRKSDRG